MDDQKLLNQISGMLKAELSEFREEMNQRFAEQSTAIDAKLDLHTAAIDAKLDLHTAAIDAKLDQQSREIKLYIENNVTAHLKALSDGYKMTFDKVADHEERITALEDRRFA